MSERTRHMEAIELDDCIKCHSIEDLRLALHEIGLNNALILAGDSGMAILEVYAPNMTNTYDPDLKALDYDPVRKIGFFITVPLNGSGGWESEFPDNTPIFLVGRRGDPNTTRIQ